MKCQLSTSLGLEAYTVKKPRLNTSKIEKLVFAKTHLVWTTKKWRKGLFSGESTRQEFISHKRFVRRPVGTTYEDSYTDHDVMQPQASWFGGQSLQMVYFLQPCTNTNDAKYLDLLTDRLNIHMVVHDSNNFMYDGA